MAEPVWRLVERKTLIEGQDEEGHSDDSLLKLHVGPCEPIEALVAFEARLVEPSGQFGGTKHLNSRLIEYGS